MAPDHDVDQRGKQNTPEKLRSVVYCFRCHLSAPFRTEETNCPVFFLLTCSSLDNCFALTSKDVEEKEVSYFTTGV